MTPTRGCWLEKAEGFPTTAGCRVAELSRRAFYDWCQRAKAGPTVAEQEEEALVELMGEIHDEFDETYGSPRMTVELTNQGYKVNQKRVERLMRLYGIVGVTNQPKFGPQSLLSTTRRYPIWSPGTSQLADPTSPGFRTSPTSQPLRAGYIWQP